jgi:hypothetical protein
LANVRFGSLAGTGERIRDVVFTPDSGYSSVQVGCPKSAKSGYPAFCTMQRGNPSKERLRHGGFRLGV